MHDLAIEKLLTAVDKKPQLCSIFDRVTLNGEPPPKRRNGLDACMLTEQNIVSGNGGLSLEALQGELARLSELHPDAQADTYFYLLQKYGWRIGQPGMDEDELQDVAFCDAFRVEHAMKEKGDTGGYLLVKGDLSGIQGYIYGNIQQNTAGGLGKLAKRLRGRSIIVTLLTDFLANVMLRELNLPVWNLLFAGGGHFNLLLPDTPSIKSDLEKISQKLDSEMRRRFDDRLQLITAIVDCTAEEIVNNAGKSFERLNAERERKKYQQHQLLYDHFYPSEEQQSRGKIDDWEINIGRRFPKITTVVEAVTEGPVFKTGDLPEIITLEMQEFTYSLLVVEDLENAYLLLDGTPGLISAQIFTLNNTNFLPARDRWSGKIAQPIGFGFRFTGKYVPDIDTFEDRKGVVENRPKTFEEIAGTDALEMLGAIRLDVDDLGYIFSHGMAKATLEQIVTLSRDIQYFFSVHFDRLAEKYQLYVIYSGGDDAFAVGQWKNLIDFVRDLRIDFHQFVFKNKLVHFSAGIFLGDPKYPVGRFYIDTGELLDEAKDSNYDKNRVHIFHQITNWEAFDKKIKFGAELSEMLTPGESPDNPDRRKLSMAFAYRLLTLSKTSFYERTVIENGKSYKRGSLNARKFARNVSNMRYLFARNGYNKAKTDEILEGVEKELITDLFRNFSLEYANKEQSIHDNLIALNYALYTIRSQKNAE
jgi:CRISPR-associated protein Csm1